MLNQDQINSVLRAVLSKPYWPSDAEDIYDAAGNLQDVTQRTIVATEFQKVNMKAFASPELLLETLSSIIVSIHPRLVKKVSGYYQEPEVDPVVNIPHQDLFPGVRTVEGWLRYAANKRKHGLVTSADVHRKFVDLGEYLRANNIREAVVEEKPLTKTEQARKDLKDKWALIEARIDAAKSGSAQSSVGYYERQRRFQERVRAGFWERINNGEGWAAAEAYANEQIKIFEGTSVR